MGVSLLLVIFLLCCTEGETQMKLSPSTLTVLRGSEARFTCSPGNARWTVMVWILNGKAELTISRNNGVLPWLNPNVTAERGPNSRGESWVFVLRSTERHNHGQVTCDLQGIDTKTANLFVQEKGSVKVLGEEKLAFKGQTILFQCEGTGWYPQPTVQWQVNNKTVIQGDFNTSSEELVNNLFSVNSNFSVRAAVSSHVDCLASVSALSTPLRSSTRLLVFAEVVQDVDDCTVPLAVTASLCALLLLILLCICTVLYYRQRRQANRPQEGIRFNQSVAGNNLVVEAPGGRVNKGYSSESRADAAYNELIMETHSQTDCVSFPKVPDAMSSHSPSLQSEAQASLSEENFKSVRRITTV
ncbi:immunoglobulin superfamily member 5 isoform X2 [Gouania willdenowi]|uniref:immunoglobulin superfamily member 5 isoform X2 n=1 Tax=Gouania willdenowi TaxID=441366 RepID=UPI001055EB02|nr:immunoglobulin superfamily member 5-like isoform X2 [Gouania willdenowi]